MVTFLLVCVVEVRVGCEVMFLFGHMEVGSEVVAGVVVEGREVCGVGFWFVVVVDCIDSESVRLRFEFLSEFRVSLKVFVLIDE